MVPTQSLQVSIWGAFVSVWALFRTHMDIELRVEDAKNPEPKFGAWCHSKSRSKQRWSNRMSLTERSDRPLGGVA